MFLDAAQLAELTGREKPSAQIRELERESQPHPHGISMIARFRSIGSGGKMPLESDSTIVDWNALMGRVELRSWLEYRADGSAVGMGSKTEFDAQGRILSHRVEPTGARLILG